MSYDDYGDYGYGGGRRYCDYDNYYRFCDWDFYPGCYRGRRRRRYYSGY